MKKMTNTLTTSSDLLFELISDGLTENEYVFADGFFSADEVTILANRLHKLDSIGQLQQAGIGSQKNYQTLKTVRGDHIKWIEEGQSIAGDFFLNRIHELVQFINRTCFLGIRDMEFHFAKYPIGTFYKRHSDNFQHSNNRKISVVCYLNEGWKKEDGGQLRLYLPQPDGTESIMDIDPVGGRVACFFSHIEHEVLPTHRERLSATGWLLNEKSFIK